jgi:hypothetical protein
MVLILDGFLFGGPPNEVPQRGQKDACGTSGALQRGQELVIGGDDGEEVPGTGAVSISDASVPAFPFAACIASYNIGRSGCVL